MPFYCKGYAKSNDDLQFGVLYHHGQDHFDGETVLEEEWGPVWLSLGVIEAPGRGVSCFELSAGPANANLSHTLVVRDNTCLIEWRPE